MNEYIMNRIIEIIEKSQDIYNESKNSDEFVHLSHFKIYKDFAEEFKNLMDSERTVYLLNNQREKITNNNEELLNICREKIKSYNENIEDYLELLEMIYNSYMGEDLRKIEYLGYCVLKEDFQKFCSICKKLKIGVSAFLRKENSQDFKYKIEESKKNNKEQFLRIVQQFKKLKSIDLVKEPIIKIVEDIEELVLFFSFKEDFNINSLRAVIPGIGIYNFHYLINKLYENNTIDFDDYKKYLEDFNFIEKKQKK